MPSPYFNKKTLKHLYINRHLSTYSIADRFGCDPKTVYRWLKIYKVPARPRKLIPISKAELMYYYKKGLSLGAIGDKYNCCATTILKKFRKYDIQTRKPWENNTIHIKNNFSGNLLEKAYLIGFRIGDLGVNQKSSNSSVVIKSNTTKKEQVRLLRQMFSKYGPVWISKSPSRKNVYHFTATVNNSFLFLMPKHKTIPRWITKSKKLFLNFIAGYVDAEGSFGVYNKRAVFRVGSYDSKILKQINNFFIQQNIKSTCLLEKKSGIYGKHKLNKDFYRTCVREKYSLYTLFNQLVPLLKHKNRIKCAKFALANVVSRME